MEGEINPPSQEWEILICQFTHGLTSFRKDDKEGTTEILRMTALTSLSYSGSIKLRIQKERKGLDLNPSIKHSGFLCSIVFLW